MIDIELKIAELRAKNAIETRIIRQWFSHDGASDYIVGTETEVVCIKSDASSLPILCRRDRGVKTFASKQVLDTLADNRDVLPGYTGLWCDWHN